MDWAQEIRHLYHLNNLRAEETTGSQKFLGHQENLEKAMSAFKEKADEQLPPIRWHIFLAHLECLD